MHIFLFIFCQADKVVHRRCSVFYTPVSVKSHTRAQSWFPLPSLATNGCRHSPHLLFALKDISDEAQFHVGVKVKHSVTQFGYHEQNKTCFIKKWSTLEVRCKGPCRGKLDKWMNKLLYNTQELMQQLGISSAGAQLLTQLSENSPEKPKSVHEPFITLSQRVTFWILVLLSTSQ